MEDLEAVPEEEDLFSVDESLSPVEAIQRYSFSTYVAQRHAYIRVRGSFGLCVLSRCMRASGRDSNMGMCAHVLLMCIFTVAGMH
jgi:hypothetical protein